MRLFFALLVSVGICIGLFFGMHLMTSSNASNITESSKNRPLVYLREKNDSNIERKKRVKPKEPVKKPPVKKIKIVKTNLTPKVNQNVKIKPFKALAKNIDISAISSLSGAQVEMGGLLDANSLRALKKVNPKYPRRAKMKKQAGSVQLAFDIDKEGLVSNVKILDSNPKGVFEKSSIRAIKKWKFKPNEFERTASITFNFRLAR
ncbi:energy transducer TonB [Poseidonibacter lekithochrous]|uniref:energy transducer TonB n=1 Tax=Poseidonibacter lekithochrous TaxID=1904463 RepID=UPI0008FC97B4|nr:energy transducer TonB [Poseidonibacter lekithochrous]QKJ21857.1 energy transduction protein TonB [Poseidonibacter lekithochrous]